MTDTKFILFAINGSQALVILTLKEFNGISSINEIANTCKLARATVKSALGSLKMHEIVIPTTGFETFALSNKGREFLGMPEDAFIEKIEDTHNPGFVYFIDNGEYIKIGYSIDPNNRMRNLQKATEKPLELLAVIPGSKADEKKLHKQFEVNHVRGEWYSRTTELNNLMDSHSLAAEKNFFSRNSNKESLIFNKDKINTNTAKKIISHDFLKAQGVWSNQIEQIATLANYDLALLEAQFNGDDLPLILWRIKTGVPPPEKVIIQTEEEKRKKYIEGPYSDLIEK